MICSKMISGYCSYSMGPKVLYILKSCLPFYLQAWNRIQIKKVAEEICTKTCKPDDIKICKFDLVKNILISIHSFYFTLEVL